MTWKRVPHYRFYVRDSPTTGGFPWQRPSVVEFWCFHWCLSEQVAEQTFVSRVVGNAITQKTKFMGSTWGPPGSCRPQMGPMLVPWTLLSGCTYVTVMRAYKLHPPLSSAMWGSQLQLVDEIMSRNRWNGRYDCIMIQIYFQDIQMIIQ